MLHLPKGLLEDLRSVPNFEEQAFIAAHQNPPIVSIRIHPFKSNPNTLPAQKIPWCENGYYLPQRPVFTLDPAYHAGAYYVQEASSMFLEQFFKPIFNNQKGLRILDLCAAPGGKSSHIAALADNNSLIISNEVIRTRATILEENMVRWGNMNTWVTCNDPRSFVALTGYFDVIIIDAPCSGSGLFRKDKKALDDWNLDNVQMCTQRQQRIINDIIPCLKEGGIVIYSTCSFSTCENEGILDWVAENYDIEPFKLAINNEWGVLETFSPLKKMPGYRFLPNLTLGEGFFITAFKKLSSSAAMLFGKFQSLHDKRSKILVAPYFNHLDWVIVQSDKENYNAINQLHEADLYLLKKQLYFRKIGTPVGQPIKNEWVPAHQLALCNDVSNQLPIINLNREYALKYLKRDEWELEIPPKGWYLIQYEGLNLGWIKSIGYRINNYLPKDWRIRMELPSDLEGK